jgi:hypothetical protein
MNNPYLTKDPYLVWSTEFSGWLGPSRVGYVSNIENAGQFSHAAALEVCVDAKPGRRTNEQLRNLRYGTAMHLPFVPSVREAPGAARLVWQLASD